MNYLDALRRPLSLEYLSGRAGDPRPRSPPATPPAEQNPPHHLLIAGRGDLVVLLPGLRATSWILCTSLSLIQRAPEVRQPLMLP